MSFQRRKWSFNCGEGGVRITRPLTRRLFVTCMRILKDIYGLFSSSWSQFWFHNICGYVTWWWSHDWQNLSKSFTWSKSWLFSKREFEAAFSPNEVCLPATQRFKHKNQYKSNLTRPWSLWFWMICLRLNDPKWF